MKRNGLRWKARVVFAFVLIWPLYVLPKSLRALLTGDVGWALGALFADVFGCLLVGFLTNNYRFALLLYLGATAFEAALLYGVGWHRGALWMGDLIPALVGIYYAQQLFLNMGD